MNWVLYNAAIIVKMFWTFSVTNLDVTTDPIKDTPIIWLQVSNEIVMHVVRFGGTVIDNVC